MSAAFRPIRKRRFFHEHSLSLTVLAVTLAWFILYIYSDPQSHWGSFFGNAIADWSGACLIIIVTKYLHENGSAESRPFQDSAHTPFARFLVEHSLSLCLSILLLISTIAYLKMDPSSKWGNVIGNIVSQLVQLLALVLFTKKLLERGSKETDSHGKARP